MRIIDHFDRGAALYPERDCLHDGTRGWRFREIRDLTHRIALGLRDGGVGGTSKVAIYSPNDTMAYACLLGILRAGAIWVPINARNVIDENLYILANTDTEWLFYHSTFEPHLPRVRAEAPKIKHFVCIDRPGPVAPGLPALADWIVPYDGAAPELDENPDGVCILLSSGGTTGRPKGVMQTNRVYETLVANFLAAMPLEEPPVHLMVAPMTHAAGVTSFAFLAAGATTVPMANTDPEAIMAAIERHRVSHVFMPPTMIYMLLAHPKVRDYDYSSLKALIYAAAPMSSDKLRQAIEVFGPVLTQTYGQSEACMICTFLSARDHIEALESGNAHRLLSCGRPAAFTPVEIMDDAGNLLAPDQAGEIVVRGGLVMKGYYKNPQATAEASEYGWHHTGDIGRKDADGFVYILDRKKDMIISGGFNVFPSEIEQVIWTHPAVRDCAVIGVPHEKWGEAVTAVVELKDGAAVAEAELIQLCKDRLGSVKAPKSVLIWDELPRSPVGKVLKREIRKPFWQGQERQI